MILNYKLNIILFYYDGFLCFDFIVIYWHGFLLIYKNDGL